MSLTPEELAAMPEELQVKFRELQDMAAKSEEDKLRLQIEKDAAESLLSNINLQRPDQRPSTRNLETSPRDFTGNANMESLVRDASTGEINSDEFDKEIDEAAKAILQRFSDEQLRDDPNTIRAAIHMFGKSVGQLAFKRAFQHSINVFQKAVTMKSNIDAIIGQWRLDNPDLANDKQSEDLVEFFLMKRVIIEPKNKNKQLPELLDIATMMTRDYLKGVEGKGRDEERRSNETVVPLTLRPRSGSGNGPVRRTAKEEEPMTEQESAERYLAMRTKMASKTAWTGRPS